LAAIFKHAAIHPVVIVVSLRKREVISLSADRPFFRATRGGTREIEVKTGASSNMHVSPAASVAVLELELTWGSDVAASSAERFLALMAIALLFHAAFPTVMIYDKQHAAPHEHKWHRPNGLKRVNRGVCRGSGIVNYGHRLAG
jgi:hypothetical protein